MQAPGGSMNDFTLMRMGKLQLNLIMLESGAFV